jgi:hypothetical protein
MEKIKLICRTTEEEIWVPKALLNIIEETYKSHYKDLAIKDTFLSIKAEIVDKVKRDFLVDLPLSMISVTYDDKIEQGVIEIRHEWIASSLNVDSPHKYEGLVGVP